MDAVLLVRLLEPLILLVSLTLLVWASLPEANPLVATYRPVWRFFTRKNYFLYATIGFAIIAIDVWLTALDENFTNIVKGWRGGEDFTPLLWAIEGDFIKVFQKWTWTPLTWYMGWAYIIVFSAVMPWAMVVFDYLGETRRNISLLIGYLINYLLVLPFYFFFPVLECHEYRPGGEPFVRLLLDDIDPAIMEVLRPMSGVDNCFPSFHTSLFVTVALFAWFSGRRAFGILMAVLCCSVILSTLYLGIHWVTDVAAGIIVGILGYVLGEWLGRKYWARRTARRRSAV